MLDRLKTIDKQQAKLSGVKFFWIVESADEVALFLKSNSFKLSKMDVRTHDFTTMYDNLELDELLSTVQEAIDFVFDHEAPGLNCQPEELKVGRPRRSKKDKKRTFTFFSPNELDESPDVLDKHKIYCLDDVKKLLSFCILNTYIFQGGKLRKQQKGIPMGANASPDLANIFCHMKERAHMLQLLETGQYKQAKLLSNTKRYIDDLLCFGTDPPPPNIYNMEYRRTNNNEGDATFLGIRVRNEVNRITRRHYLRLSVLDKTAEYPYQPLAYTTVYSTAPASFGSSILIGGLVRASRITNNLPDLKSEINNVVLKLVRRGHPSTILKRAFLKWLLDTYPEPKFQEFCDKIKRHFFYLIAESKRILDGVGNVDARIKALKEERPYIKYRDLLVATPEAPLPTQHVISPSSSPEPPVPTQQFTSSSSSSTTSTSTSSDSSGDSILDIQSDREQSSSTTRSDTLRCPGCGATGPATGPNRGRPFRNKTALTCHQNKCKRYKNAQSQVTNSSQDSTSVLDTSSQTSD